MIPNRRLLIPYFAPYFAYVLIASVLGDHLSTEVNYLLRIVVVASLLLWSKQWLFSIFGPKSPVVSVLYGFVAGLLGLLIWVLLLTPFVSPGSEEPWSNRAFFLRLLAAGFLVPVFEEYVMRGFIFRFALQWNEVRQTGKEDALQVTLDDKSVNDVGPGDWSWMAVVISVLAFTSGHHVAEWPASIAYGLLMAWLYISRKDLLSCIVAHSVTNISLALYVLYAGHWHLW